MGALGQPAGSGDRVAGEVFILELQMKMSNWRRGVVRRASWVMGQGSWLVESIFGLMSLLPLDRRLRRENTLEVTEERVSRDPAKRGWEDRAILKSIMSDITNASFGRGFELVYDGQRKRVRRGWTCGCDGLDEVNGT